MTNLNTTAAQLDSALKTLRQRWEAATALWNDKVRWGFEKEHWTPLEGQTQGTLDEMERLERVISQARSSVR